MAKPKYGRVGGVLMNANSCRQLAPALLVAVPSLLIYAMAMMWMYNEAHHPQPSVMLGVEHQSKMVQKVYAEDEARGQQIIREMDGKVASPMWVKLVKNKDIRGAFAAALGSAASSGGNVAFDIGNMLSGLPGSGSPKKTHNDVNQHSHTLQLTSPHHPVEAHAVSVRDLPVRAAVAARKAKKAAPKVPKALVASDYFHTAHKHNSVPIVYDAFAPGVLTGNAPAPVHHITAPAPKPKPVINVKDVKKNLEKVTGFADNYAKDDSAEAKLSKKVEELKKENKDAHAKLLLTQKNEEAKRLKLLKKVQEAKATKAATEAKQAAAKKQAAPRFDGKFSDFVGGKGAAKSAGETDKRVFGLLKAVEAKTSEHVETSHEAKDKVHEDKEQQEADKLMKEIEEHASIISSPAHNRIADPMETAIGKVIAGKHLDVHGAAAEKEGKQAGAARSSSSSSSSSSKERADPKEALYKSVDNVHDWHALAKKSKQLARESGASPASAPSSEASHAKGHKQHHLKSHVQAKWITTIKKGPLPYECGMPLLAEASGFDCNKVKHVQRVPGNNHILHDIEDVGLGDTQERSGDLQPQEEIVPSVHVTPAAAIRALGYSNAHQYERHALLKTIAKEEERIQGYKAREAEQNGGLGKIKRRWRPVESRAERKRRLEREIQHEEGEVEGEEQGLGGIALKHALRDDVGHLGDLQVPVALPARRIKSFCCAIPWTDARRAAVPWTDCCSMD